MQELDPRIHQLRQTLVPFLNATVELQERRPAQPEPCSVMAQDIANFGNDKPFVNAMTVADLACQYTHDHFSLFVNLLTGSVDPITSCTIIRSLLETAAIGAWAVDPLIDTVSRVSRIYAIRFESIVQQLKVLKCTKGIATADIDKTASRINAIANDAISRGITVDHVKGKVTLIGTRKPGPTDMIKEVLNAEWIYRLLSAVAHGHHWALRDIGFIKVDAEDQTSADGTLYKKRNFTDAVLLVGLHGFLAYSRLLWNVIGYRQSSRLQFEELLETTTDRLSVATDLRFWRTE